jgi:hypothetical protein
MNLPILVSPFNLKILKNLIKKKVIFKVDHYSQIREVMEFSREYEIQLQNVLLISCQKLSEIDLDSTLKDLPIALQVGGLGRFRDFIKLRDKLSKFNLRIYLPAHTREECTTIWILSSLGFHCCAVMNPSSGSEFDWNALKELAVFSMFPRKPHGDIDPFTFIGEHFEGNAVINFKTVYFDDPSRFLHVDEEGRLSLSPKDQKTGKYLNVQLEQYHLVLEQEEYKKSLQSWKSFFIERTKCGQCEAWLVCNGFFTKNHAGSGCLEVFREVLEGAETFKNQRKNFKRIWRL